MHTVHSDMVRVETEVREVVSGKLKAWPRMGSSWNDVEIVLLLFKLPKKRSRTTLTQGRGHLRNASKVKRTQPGWFYRKHV